jgi:hypothetical protein
VGVFSFVARGKNERPGIKLEDPEKRIRGSRALNAERYDRITLFKQTRERQDNGHNGKAHG